jgi:hypothetical protein
MSVEKFILSNKSKTISQNIPFTQISNHVINNIKNGDAFLVWCYLLSKSSDWKVIKQNIKNIYGFGDTKIKQIFSYLRRSNLISYVQVHCANGQIAHWDIHVLNGQDFIINQQYRSSNSDDSSNMHTTGSEMNPVANGGLLNKELITKQKEKLLCASDDAQDKFPEFWELYPKKKNKMKAFQEWRKNKCNLMADEIITDVQNRIKNDPDWSNVQFIPLPSTYLHNKRWEDDIREVTNEANRGNSQISSSREVFRTGSSILKGW